MHMQRSSRRTSHFHGPEYQPSQVSGHTNPLTTILFLEGEQSSCCEDKHIFGKDTWSVPLPTTRRRSAQKRQGAATEETCPAHSQLCLIQEDQGWGRQADITPLSPWQLNPSGLGSDRLRAGLPCCRSYHTCSEDKQEAQSPELLLLHLSELCPQCPSIQITQHHLPLLLQNHRIGKVGRDHSEVIWSNLPARVRSS